MMIAVVVLEVLRNNGYYSNKEKNDEREEAIN